MKQLRILLIVFGMLLCSACSNHKSSEKGESTTALNEIEETQSQKDETEQDKQIVLEENVVSTEVSRAIAYGLVPEEIQGDYEKIITYRQYIEMINNFMRTYDESRFDEWTEIVSSAAESEKKMLREDGILVTAYAMVHMGKVEYSGSDWEYFDTIQAYIDSYSYDLTWDYPLFSNWEDIVFEWINCNYIQGGLVKCAIEKSKVSGLPIYPYDFEREGKHFKDELTREEAISAVLRFAETEDCYVKNIPLPENMDFSASKKRIDEITFLAEEKKQEILKNTEMTKCTGTAYYVSNSGNDDNDGTSPETAWATLDKVKNYTFQSGDGIYFERGGIWRGAVGYFENSVIISAYGDGEKPRIYGSPENGAEVEKWELYSDENGIRIWKYKGTGTDCAGIVLNDGETVAKRVYAWYDGDKFYDSKDRAVVFDMKTALCEDLYFYCDIDLKKHQLPYYPDLDNSHIQIYLRCDKGNPGEIYDSIEFISKSVTDDVGNIVFGTECMLENLCIMYHAGTAVSMTEFDNCTIQNCEFGWCGTRLDLFFEPENGEPGIWTDGNVIQLIGSNCIVQNNYIHDVDGGGIVLELGGDIAQRVPFIGNVITNNLIERCGDPIYIRNNDDDEIEEAFGEMEISNNYIMDTGDGWYENQPSYINPAFYTGHSQNALNYYGEALEDGKAIKVMNNVFCRAYHGLMYFSPTTDIPYMEGNIYIQRYGETVVETPGAMIKATQPDEIQKGLEFLYLDKGDVVVLQPE